MPKVYLTDRARAAEADARADKALARRIRVGMLDKGLHRDALAQALALSQGTITNRLGKAPGDFRVRELRALARLLGTDVRTLLGGDGT